VALEVFADRNVVDGKRIDSGRKLWRLLTRSAGA